MVVDMVVRYVESPRQIPISFESGTLVVALERRLSPRWFRYVGPGIAANFLLLALTITSYDIFERAGLVLLAGRRSVARLLTRMSARLLRLSALLLAMLMGIFTIPRLMACLSAVVRSAFEWLAADQPTRNISSPTRLILQGFLPAQTCLLCQERTFWTILFLWMATVLDLGMTTILHSGTRKGARRWLSAAWQRSLEHGSPTSTGDVIKKCFLATPARPPMAEVLTTMVPTFELSTTRACTNMLGFDLIVQ